MNVVREIQKINEEELKLGLTEERSWHYQYRSSSWIYIGNIPLECTEGDILCIFSQWGEIEDIHLVRDEQTGRSKGFCFLKYEDYRSTILAVDNMNGSTVVNRTLRVDHKLNYTPPIKKEKNDNQTNSSDTTTTTTTIPVHHQPGYTYQNNNLINDYNIHHGVNLFSAQSQSTNTNSNHQQHLQNHDNNYKIMDFNTSSSSSSNIHETHRASDHNQRLSHSRSRSHSRTSSISSQSRSSSVSSKKDISKHNLNDHSDSDNKREHKHKKHHHHSRHHRKHHRHRDDDHRNDDTDRKHSSSHHHRHHSSHHHSSRHKQRSYSRSRSPVYKSTKESNHDPSINNQTNELDKNNSKTTLNAVPTSSSTTVPTSSTNLSASNAGAYPSWRGRRDPAFLQQQQQSQTYQRR